MFMYIHTHTHIYTIIYTYILFYSILFFVILYGVLNIYIYIYIYRDSKKKSSFASNAGERILDPKWKNKILDEDFLSNLVSINLENWRNMIFLPLF